MFWEYCDENSPEDRKSNILVEGRNV